MAKAPPRPLTMQEQAALLAGAIVDPQIATVNRSINQAQLDRDRSATGYAGVIDALGRITSPIPNAIQSAYEKAATQTAGIAGGLTGQIGDAARAAAAATAARISGLGGIGADTIHTDLPQGMEVANYVHGALPASSLAAEAASRLAAAEAARTGSSTALAQKALLSLDASNREIAQLRAKGIDIENTRPAEIQKALLTLRDENRQDLQFALSQFNSLQDAAYNMTNQTGILHVVRNGRIVSTGQPSYAATQDTLQMTQSQARWVAEQNEKIREYNAGLRADQQKLALPDSSWSGTNGYLSDGYGNPIRDRQGRLQLLPGFTMKNGRVVKVATPRSGSNQNNGLTVTETLSAGRRAGTLARAFFFGVPNPAVYKDPKTGKLIDRKTGKEAQGQALYSERPVSAAEAMNLMLAEQIPAAIAWDTIYHYAIRKNSPWADALGWRKPSKRYPKANRGARPGARTGGR